MNNIGNKIYMYRKTRNMTRRELAEGICDESTIRKIETGKQEPRLFTLIEICKKLGISTQHLIHTFNKEDFTYILKVKQLCREYVYFQDYDALKLLLEECEIIISENIRKDTEFMRFIHWHKAILIYKAENNPQLAKIELEKLLANDSRLVSETDIGIANSIGMIHIQLHDMEPALEILLPAFHASEQSPSLEDKTLFIRVGYNYARVHYWFENYEEVIAICYKLLYHLNSHHLQYMVARIHHLISISYDKIQHYNESEQYMRKAADYFHAESKLYPYLRTMRALSEAQIKNDKWDEAMETLRMVEDRLHELDDPKELPVRISEMKQKYGIEITH